MDTAMTAYLLASEQDAHEADLYVAGAPLAGGDLSEPKIVLLAGILALMAVLLLGTLP